MVFNNFCKDSSSVHYIQGIKAGQQHYENNVSYSKEAHSQVKPHAVITVVISKMQKLIVSWMGAKVLVSSYNLVSCKLSWGWHLFQGTLRIQHNFPLLGQSGLHHERTVIAFLTLCFILTVLFSSMFPSYLAASVTLSFLFSKRLFYVYLSLKIFSWKVIWLQLTSPFWTIIQFFFAFFEPTYTESSSEEFLKYPSCTEFHYSQ